MQSNWDGSRACEQSHSPEPLQSSKCTVCVKSFHCRETWGFQERAERLAEASQHPEITFPGFECREWRDHRADDPIHQIVIIS